MYKYLILLQKGIQHIASSTSTARLLIFGKIPESPKFLVRFYILGSTGLVAQFSIWVNFASTRLYFTLKNEFNTFLLRLKVILKAIHFVNNVCTIFSLKKKDPPRQTFPS